MTVISNTHVTIINLTRAVNLWFYQFVSHYPVIYRTTDHQQDVVAEWSKAPIGLSWSGVGLYPARDRYFRFDIFAPCPNPMQMKSNMTIPMYS